MNTKTPRQFVTNLKSYSEQLRTPEWKAFRQRVIDVNGRACRACRRSDKIIQVHHLFYEKTRKPWDYELNEVTVLCEDCHASMHDELQKFRKFVFDKLEPQTFRIVNGALCVALTQYDRLTFSHALAEFVSSPNMVSNYAKAWRAEA